MRCSKEGFSNGGCFGLSLMKCLAGHSTKSEVAIAQTEDIDVSPRVHSALGRWDRDQIGPI